MNRVFELSDPNEARECSARKVHAAREHHPHPRTGRPVCFVCHPPAEVLIERNARAAKKA